MSVKSHSRTKMSDKFREKDMLIGKLVDFAIARFAEGDFETVKKVLTTIGGEKIQSPKFRFIRAKYAIHEGRLSDAESLLSQSLSDNHLLNRNIIRIIYGLPKSKTLVDLMRKVMVHHSQDLAEISLEYRKEFLVRAAIYYKDIGKRKEAVECLLDQSNGPSIMDDDYTIRLAAALQPALGEKVVEVLQKDGNKYLLGVYYLQLYKRDPRKLELYLKKELERQECNTKVLIELAHHFILSGQTQKAEQITNHVEKHITHSDVEQMNELQCQVELINCMKLPESYTKHVVDERIKFMRRVTSIVEVATTKRLMRISATILWTITLPLLEPQLKLDEMDKYIIGALNMMVTVDPHNPNGFNAYRELSRFALQKENLTAAARHLINAVNLCPDPVLKQKLHREARMISAAVNLYNRPETDLEQAGKLIQEASIAPQTKVNPILIQAGRILSSQFVEKYQIQKKLIPINPAFMTTYQSSLEMIHSTIQADDLTVIELWYKILKLARKHNCWRLLRVVGRQIAIFNVHCKKTVTIDESDTESAAGTCETPNTLTAGQNTASRPTSMKKSEKVKSDVYKDPHDDGPPKATSKEHKIGRICCESMLLEAEGWIQLLRHGGSDLFVHSDRLDPDVASVEVLISKFVIMLMKDCLALASELELNYLIHNASVYLWNYAQKLRISGNLTHIPMMFSQPFECLTNKTELAPNLIIQIATVLASSPLIESEEPASGSTGNESINSGKRSKTPEKGKKASKTRMSAEDQRKRDNITASLEICERAIESTRSHELEARSLIELARHWLRQRLELGRMNSENIQAASLKIGANPLKMETPLVYIWLSLDLYYFGHTAGSPSLIELAETIDKIHSQPEVLIGQTPLIISAYRYLACICLNSNMEMIPLARSCCESALKLFDGLNQTLKSQCSREVAFCHLLLGQVIRNENGDLKDIQNEFVLCADLSEELALSATTKWWNASLKLTNEVFGRKMLAKQAKQLINAISRRPRLKGCAEIRARLYSIVVKKFIDDDNYQGALRELDTALQSMPKIPERLVLLLQRIECKAHLGIDASLDIQRVGAESPEYLATNWRDFAVKQKVLNMEDKAMVSLYHAIENAPAGQLRSELLLEHATLLEKNGRYIEAFEALLQITNGPEAIIRCANKICQLSKYNVVSERMEKEKFYLQRMLDKARKEIDTLVSKSECQPPVPSAAPKKKGSAMETAPVIEISEIEKLEISNCRELCSALYHLSVTFKELGLINCASDCALLITMAANKCNEYSWKTIGLLTSLSIAIQNKSTDRIELERTIAERVPVPVNETVESDLPIDAWVICAQLMLRCGFLDSALNVCDSGLCICAVNRSFVNNGSMSLFYQTRGATMLKLYESKQRMNDAIYCLEKAMEHSANVPCKFWPKQAEYMVAAILRSKQTCRETKAESLFDQIRFKLKERAERVGINVEIELANISFNQAEFLADQGTIFHRIEEVFEHLEHVQSVFKGEKYGLVILEHGKIFIKKIHYMMTFATNPDGNQLQKEDKVDIMNMVEKLSGAIELLQNTDTRNVIIGELQLTLALLVATVASYVYKTKKQEQAEINELSPVEKKIELYVKEYTDLEGWEHEWSKLEEAAAQSALSLLFTLSRDDTFDQKTRARALLYMGRLPNELDAEEICPWNDNFTSLVALEKFSNSRKNSVWLPYEENLKASRAGNDFCFDVILDDDSNSGSNRTTQAEGRRGVSFVPSKQRWTHLTARTCTQYQHLPSEMNFLPEADAETLLAFWKTCTLSEAVQVESTHHLLLAAKLCEEDVEIMIESSTSLLNLIGPTDPLFSFNVLLQLQSAQASKFFQRLLSQACNAPNASRLSYCIRLHFSQIYGDNSIDETLWSSINEFRSWRNAKLNTTPNLSSIAYPVIVFQHADGLLYAGLYNPANKNVRVARSRGEIGELKEVQDEVLDIRQKLLSDCLKREYNQEPEEEDGNEPNKDQSQAQIGSRPTSKASGKSGDTEGSDDADEELDLTDITEQLGEYLSNIMEQLSEDLEEIPENQPILLIADCHLLDFPLELLPEFRNRPVSRDFSIQIHQERMAQQESDDKKGKGNKGAPSDSNNVPVSKILALGTPGKCLDMLSEHKIGWSVKSGLSTGELETMISDSSGLLYCGRERFLASLAPSRVAALDLQKLQLAILIDRSPEPNSFIQQNKLDLGKDPVQIQAENYLNTVALLTLAGVSTIMLNQWSSDQVSNQWRMKEITTGMQHQISASETLLYIRDPTKKPKDEKQAKKGAKKGTKNTSPSESETNVFALSQCQAFNTVCYGIPSAYIN